MVDSVRRNGAYAPLSANYADDDAVAQLDLDENDTAELLYLRSLAYCARDLELEGFVSDIALRTGRVLRRRKMDRVVKAAEALVNVGIWERTDNGYRITGWLKWNKSWEEITHKRRSDADRKRGTGRGDSATTPRGSAADSEQHAAGVAPPEALTRHVHDTSRHPPEGALAPLDAEPDAGTVVAAFVDGATNAGLSRPGQSIRGRVGKQAAALLAQGQDPQVLLTAAGQLGASGYDDLERQVRRVEAERAGTNLAVIGSGPKTRASTSDAAAQQALEAGARVAARHLAQEGA